MIALVSVALLPALILVDHHAFTLTDQAPMALPATSLQQTENIDSLVALIRKDKHYHIRDVIFAHKDSTLLIVIAGAEATTSYFNTKYHIPTLRTIDGITILNTNNRQLDADSKRGVRMLSAFKDKWCTANECRPLTARIKQDISRRETYKSLRMWISWLGDSSVVVIDSFLLEKNSGRLTTKKAQAQINMQGKILVYHVIE